MHACQIGPTDTAPLARGRLTCPVLELGVGNASRQATFLPPFLRCLLFGTVGATLLFESMAVVLLAGRY